MFWLDGSSSLPFPIVSPSFLRGACVEDLAEVLTSLEHQARIAKACAELGNFDHWCLAASEVVDIADLLFDMDNSFLYYEGIISESEMLRRCSQLSSQLVDSVSFSTFERVRKRLFAKSKINCHQLHSNPSPEPIK
jgi:hypothetical protein